VATFDYVPLRDKWYRKGRFSERTCLDALEQGSVEYGSTPVMFVKGETVTNATVGEIHQQAKDLAAALQQRGVGPGEAVAVQLTNRMECAVAYQAVLLCGAVLAPIVHIYGGTEVGLILAESRAKALIMLGHLNTTSYLDEVVHTARISCRRSACHGGTR
jgi:acyl-CoA synthetase (AMP-forming)/AMP-acid ligase II